MTVTRLGRPWNSDTKQIAFVPHHGIATPIYILDEVDLVESPTDVSAASRDQNSKKFIH